MIVVPVDYPGQGDCLNIVSVSLKVKISNEPPKIGLSSEIARDGAHGILDSRPVFFYIIQPVSVKLLEFRLLEVL